jgi:hypothetical protein
VRAALAYLVVAGEGFHYNPHCDASRPQGEYAMLTPPETLDDKIAHALLTAENNPLRSTCEQPKLAQRVHPLDAARILAWPRPCRAGAEAPAPSTDVPTGAVAAAVG